MVAAEDQPARIESDLPRDAGHELPKPGRSHAGIAAILVDLVACRLDQNRGPVGHALQESGFDGERVGRADRRDADARAGMVETRKIRDR